VAPQFQKGCARSNVSATEDGVKIEMFANDAATCVPRREVHMSWHNKRSLLGAIVFAAAIQQAPATQTGVVFVGRWENAPTTTTGIGQVVEFTSNGTLYATPGSLVHGRYFADSLKLVQVASSPPETVTVQISIRADTMTQYALDRVDSVRLIRRDSIQAAHGVAGVWTSRGPTGKESIVEYRANGSFKLWVPFDTDTGSYQVRADTLLINGGQLNGRYLWTMVTGRLRLQQIADVVRPAIVFTKSGGSSR